MIPPPHAYQTKATQFLIDKKFTYIAADMGIGKTRIAIDWAMATNSSVLVVAPLRATLVTWPDEIEKWAPGASYHVMHGADKRLALNTKFHIINYDGLPWLFDQLRDRFIAKKKMPFARMIVDEGQHVKSHSTKRFKWLHQISTLAVDGITILSGTPRPNSMHDLWSQYFILDKGKILEKNISAFRAAYFDRDKYCIHKWLIKLGAEEQILQKIAPVTYRLDAEDHLSVPPRIDNTILVKLPDKVMVHILDLQKRLTTDLDEDTRITAKTKATVIMKYRQFIQGGVYTDDKHNYEVLHTAKLDALKELVDSANGQGIICAVNFRFEIDMIKKAFPGAAVTAGGSNPNEFVQLVRDWNAGMIPLWICHPASLSSSVNLQQGSFLLVWYSMTWSSEHYQQLNARIWRQGQQNTVIIHHIVAKGTYDEKMVAALQAKIAGQNNLLEFLRRNTDETLAPKVLSAS